MKYFITDVFAERKYAGNQLATFLDFGRLTTEEMQAMAKEINFSETTFICAPEKVDGAYEVRIFTPEKEMEFAGHPTLGTAHIIKHHLEGSPQQKVELNLKVGKIPVWFEGDVAWMRQNAPEFGATYAEEEIAQILGLDTDQFDPALPIEEVSTGFPFTIVPLRSLKALKACQVNTAHNIPFIKKAWGKGMLVFCAEAYDASHQMASRVFVDHVGIPEDPATGSATGCLAAYLLKHQVGVQDGKLQLTVGQGFEMKRPSHLYIDASLDKEYHLRIGGKVYEIAEGEWNV